MESLPDELVIRVLRATLAPHRATGSDAAGVAVAAVLVGARDWHRLLARFFGSCRAFWGKRASSGLRASAKFAFARNSALVANPFCGELVITVLEPCGKPKLVWHGRHLSAVCARAVQRLRELHYDEADVLETASLRLLLRALGDQPDPFGEVDSLYSVSTPEWVTETRLLAPTLPRHEMRPVTHFYLREKNLDIVASTVVYKYNNTWISVPLHGRMKK